MYKTIIEFSQKLDYTDKFGLRFELQTLLMSEGYHFERLHSTVLYLKKSYKGGIETPQRSMTNSVLLNRVLYNKKTSYS